MLKCLCYVPTITEHAENPILEILKKIQADAAAFREETNARLERVEDLIRKQRHDVAGILMIGKSAAGTFAENIAALEKRVAALEGGQH